MQSSQSSFQICSLLYPLAVTQGVCNKLHIHSHDVAGLCRAAEVLHPRRLRCCTLESSTEVVLKFRYNLSGFFPLTVQVPEQWCQLLTSSTHCWPLLSGLHGMSPCCLYSENRKILTQSPVSQGWSEILERRLLISWPLPAYSRRVRGLGLPAYSHRVRGLGTGLICGWGTSPSTETGTVQGLC